MRATTTAGWRTLCADRSGALAAHAFRAAAGVGCALAFLALPATAAAADPADGSWPVQPIGPVAEAVEPVEPIAPLVEPIAPLVEAVEPVEPIAPLIEPIAPVVDTVAPVMEPIAALIEPIAPVMEPIAPLIEPIAPVVDTVAPVMEPIAPVVEIVAPLVEPILPVVDTVAPLGGGAPAARIESGTLAANWASAGEGIREVKTPRRAMPGPADYQPIAPSDGWAWRQPIEFDTATRSNLKPVWPSAPPMTDRTTAIPSSGSSSQQISLTALIVAWLLVAAALTSKLLSCAHVAMRGRAVLVLTPPG